MIEHDRHKKRLEMPEISVALTCALDIGGVESPPPGEGFLLQENGFFLLQEDGFKLIWT